MADMCTARTHVYDWVQCGNVVSSSTLRLPAIAAAATAVAAATVAMMAGPTHVKGVEPTDAELLRAVVHAHTRTDSTEKELLTTLNGRKTLQDRFLMSYGCEKS